MAVLKHCIIIAYRHSAEVQVYLVSYKSQHL